MEKIIIASVSTRNLIGQPQVALGDMRIWTEKAVRQGAEFILFPELNVTGYIQNAFIQQYAESIPGPLTEKVTQLACEFGVTLSCGLLEQDNERLYCTHIIVNRDGLVGKQRKIHTPVQEQPFWGLGDSINVFDVGKIKVGITVCRDSFFDEMTRTLYFKGAEVVLMPFGYYNVPRSQYLKETIHGMSLVKACWTNGFYAVVCNSAGERAPSDLEPRGAKFPGWAGVIDPWGTVLSFVDSDGNDESMVVVEITPETLVDRRNHPNFLAGELRTNSYQFNKGEPST